MQRILSKREQVQAHIQRRLAEKESKQPKTIKEQRIIQKVQANTELFQNLEKTFDEYFRENKPQEVINLYFKNTHHLEKLAQKSKDQGLSYVGRAYEALGNKIEAIKFYSQAKNYVSLCLLYSKIAASPNASPHEKAKAYENATFHFNNAMHFSIEIPSVKANFFYQYAMVYYDFEIQAKKQKKKSLTKDNDQNFRAHYEKVIAWLEIVLETRATASRFDENYYDIITFLSNQYSDSEDWENTANHKLLKVILSALNNANELEKTEDYLSLIPPQYKNDFIAEFISYYRYIKAYSEKKDFVIKHIPNWEDDDLYLLDVLEGYAHEKDYQAIEVVIKEALDNETNFEKRAHLLISKAKAYQCVGDYSNAISILTSIPGYENYKEVLIQMAHLHYNFGNIDEFETCLGHLAKWENSEDDKARSRVLHQTAILQLNYGQYSEALEALKKLSTKQQSKHFELFIKCYLHLDKHDEIKKLCEKYPVKEFSKVLKLYQENNFDRAKKLASNYILSSNAKINPGHYNLWIDLFYNDHEIKTHKDALAIFNKATRHYPTLTYFHLKKISCAYFSNKFIETFTAIDRAKLDCGFNFQIYFLELVYYARLNKNMLNTKIDEFLKIFDNAKEYLTLLSEGKLFTKFYVLDETVKIAEQILKRIEQKNYIHPPKNNKLLIATRPQIKTSTSAYVKTVVGSIKKGPDHAATEIDMTALDFPAIKSGSWAKRANSTVKPIIVESTLENIIPASTLEVVSPTKIRRTWYDRMSTESSENVEEDYQLVKKLFDKHAESSESKANEHSNELSKAPATSRSK